jgi:hypothetical protein
MAVWNDRWFGGQAMPPNGFPQGLICHGDAREKDQTCENLVRKITTGEFLNDGEKSHLAACEGCMAQVVRMLDESAASATQGRGMAAGGTNGDLTGARPEAKKALEQGRRVFEREFGISLSKE